MQGVLRAAFIAPALGDLPARQLGVFTGSLLILVIAWATARWLGARTLTIRLRVGALWVALMVAFEAGLGLALGVSPARIAADYDPTQGGFMLLGLAVLLCAPALGARFRAPPVRQA